MNLGKPLKPDRAIAWLLGMALALPGSPVVAGAPAAEEVLGVLGMDRGQIAELAQGQPVAYALKEGSADEISSGIAWHLPLPVAEVAAHLRQGGGVTLDTEVIAHGLLTEQGGKNALAPVSLSQEEAQALLDATPGDEFNLSAHEVESLKNLKRPHGRTVLGAASQHYRDILWQRFVAYRHGGMDAIAPYAREESLDSKPSLELRLAANESAILAHYWPALHGVWLGYPKALPAGAEEIFLWVEKNVENRPALILRHQISADWNGGILVLTREFYAAHSYNSSQWISGCLPYRNGTVVFQQVRSYTDQVAGVASEVKHMLGRELLKDKMLKTFQHLRDVLMGKAEGLL